MSAETTETPERSTDELLRRATRFTECAVVYNPKDGKSMMTTDIMEGAPGHRGVMNRLDYLQQGMESHLEVTVRLKTTTSEHTSAIKWLGIGLTSVSLATIFALLISFAALLGTGVVSFDLSGLK